MRFVFDSNGFQDVVISVPLPPPTDGTQKSSHPEDLPKSSYINVLCCSRVIRVWWNGALRLSPLKSYFCASFSWTFSVSYLKQKETRPSWSESLRYIQYSLKLLLLRQLQQKPWVLLCKFRAKRTGRQSLLVRLPFVVTLLPIRSSMSFIFILVGWCIGMTVRAEKHQVLWSVIQMVSIFVLDFDSTRLRPVPAACRTHTFRPVGLVQPASYEVWHTMDWTTW